MLGRLIALAATACLSSSPAAAQGRIERPGTIPHEAAATAFPERVGEFRRINVVQYDAGGLDISAGYDLVWPGGSLTLTVYVYPASQPGGGRDDVRNCRAEFESNTREIFAAPQYRDLRQGPTGRAPAVRGVDPELSHRAEYTFEANFRGRSQRLASEYDLYCFVGGRWLVKYRATAPVGFPVSEAVEAFIRSGPWPGRRPPDSVARVHDRGSAAGAPH